MISLEEYHSNQTWKFHQNWHKIELKKYLYSLDLRSEKREKIACIWIRFKKFLWIKKLCSRIKKIFSS